MHIIAIHELKSDRESMAGPLAEALGITVMEARTRLRAPGPGPFVISVQAGSGPAEQLSWKLQTAGFRTVLLSADEIESGRRAFTAKRFTLDDRTLRVESADGDLAVAYAEIKVIVRGTGISVTTSIETSKKKSLSLERAVLSGGLVFTKTTKSVRENRTEEREGFFSLFTSKGPAILFRENGISYDALGPNLKPTRIANFAFLLESIRKSCPGAIYDDRLLNKAGQSFLLGSALNPEQHLSTAAALLAKALGERE